MQTSQTKRIVRGSGRRLQHHPDWVCEAVRAAAARVPALDRGLTRAHPPPRAPPSAASRARIRRLGEERGRHVEARVRVPAAGIRALPCRGVLRGVRPELKVGHVRGAVGGPNCRRHRRDAGEGRGEGGVVVERDLGVVVLVALVLEALLRVRPADDGADERNWVGPVGEEHLAVDRAAAPGPEVNASRGTRGRLCMLP